MFRNSIFTAFFEAMDLLLDALIRISDTGTDGSVVSKRITQRTCSVMRILLMGGRHEWYWGMVFSFLPFLTCLHFIQKNSTSSVFADPVHSSLKLL